MKRLSRQFARFRALGSEAQRTLLAAAALLPLFRLGLWALGLRRFHGTLQRTRSEYRESMTLTEITELGNLVNVAARHTLGHVSCLTRSLLLEWLLLRRGVTCRLHIGVRLAQGVVDAHAWVECEGVPVNDQPDIGTKFASFGDILPLSAFQSP